MQALREAAITCANNRNTVEDCTLYTVLTLAYSCRSCICVHDGGGTAWTPPPASFPSLLPTPFRAFDLEGGSRGSVIAGRALPHHWGQRWWRKRKRKRP